MRGIVALSVAALSVFAEAGGEGSATASATGTVWTIRRVEREFCGVDHWERFNRTMFGIFDVGMEYVVDPFCYVYSSVIPKPLISCIDNFSENLEYPKRCVSSLLAAEWGMAWDSTERVLLNSTVGIGGLFDPAEEHFGIYDHGMSLSDTFTQWGIPAGPRLALPFMPRASLRGHVGYVLDYALDAKTWFDWIVPSGIFIGWSWTLTPNKAPVWRGSWETLFAHTYDDYAIFMPISAALNDFGIRQRFWHAYKENRDGMRDDGVRPPVRECTRRPDGLKGRWRTIPGYAPRSPSLDSLRALCFTPLGDDDFWWERRSIFNRDFSKSIEDRSIALDRDFPEAHYSFVPASGEAKGLLFILPGIGAGRTCSEAVAFAEELHTNGYACVIGDSIFHWEFVRSVNRGILPGNIAEDVRRYADFMGRIIEDLRSDGLVTNDLPVSVMGWSMGALTSIRLAALSECGRMPFWVHRFVAINPPASMEHAVAPFEEVRERSREWTRERAKEMYCETAMSLASWALKDHPRYDPANPALNKFGERWDYAPNLTDEQAKFLFDLTLNASFPVLVMQRHATSPFPWFKNGDSRFSRRRLYKEVGDLTMREYIARYVPFCYDGISSSDMIASADMRGLEGTLRGNGRLRVIHTRTDPLLTDSDRDFFDDALGDRITWFDEGAHCGYFYTTVFMDELRLRLNEE